MQFNLRSLAALTVLLGAAATQAQVMVQDAWVRATVAQQQATGAFMRLTSPKDVRLVGASSPLTPVVEVHEMALQDNVMRMRQVPGIELPQGMSVALKPGGYHLMLMNLKQQVKAGDTVSLTLVFEDKAGRRETQTVNAEVRALNTGSPSATQGQHRH